MTHELQPIDLTTNPELAQLADEVAHTQRPRRLRRGNTDVAVLMPATPPVTHNSPVAAAGGHRDTAALLHAIDAGYQSIPALDPPRSLQ